MDNPPIYKSKQTKYKMSFKDIIQSMGRKNKERKAKFKALQEDFRQQHQLEEMGKSANQRELEVYLNEDREAEIKEQLEVARKKRQFDINHNHNPLDVPNIMKAEWEVLKEPNQFAGKSSMFSNNEFIHKNNPNLLKSGNVLSNKKLLQSESVLKGGNSMLSNSNMFDNSYNL